MEIICYDVKRKLFSFELIYDTDYIKEIDMSVEICIKVKQVNKKIMHERDK